MFTTEPLIWAKDDEGHRHLCPFGALSDVNRVAGGEKMDCLSDDSSLSSWRTVPSNDPMGRIKFPHSVSPN